MNPRIAIYTPDLSTGGVGKMRVHLIREMVARGIAVDLLLANTGSPLFKQLPPEVRTICIKTTHPVYSLPALYRYFRSTPPDALVTDRLRLDIACQRARRLACARTRLYLSIHNPLTVKLGSIGAKKSTKLRDDFLRWAPRNDRLIAVSRGVADDLVEGLGLPREFVQVVHNPVITGGQAPLAAEPVTHPFLNPKTAPVILSAGRMTEQKDFPTLLHAFQRVRAHRDCRLLLLGDQGGLHDELLALACSLGIDDDVSLPGFDPNPYRYMSKCDLFVLSSRWEGFGNVMVEALATGLPVVATDCPVGPREILRDGALGPLVPMGDVAAMAAAIDRVLDAPADPAVLKAGVQEYTVEKSVDGYLKTFGLQ